MTLLLKHQPWTTDPETPEDEVDIDWNMWTTRQPPYHELEVGRRVVLVSGGRPNVAALTWEVELVAVAKGAYASHAEAWQLMRAQLGSEWLKRTVVTKRYFLSNGYTAAAPTEGWLLAFIYEPRRRLMLPRPEDLRFRPNG